MSVDDPFDDRLRAELAAAADGTLDPRRLEEIELLAAADPELADALERQRRAVDLIRGAGDDVHASFTLRESLERAREQQRRSRLRRRRLVLGLGGLVAAAVALAVVLAAPPGPTVEDAAAFSARPAAAAAPAAEGADLRIEQDGLAFPAWAEQGWRATGSRTGELDGRPATTVHYVKDGRAIAYTIVGGTALERPDEGREVDAGGTAVTVFDHDGRTVAVWERDGRTCVLAGDGADGAVLAALAGSTAAY